MPGTSSRLPFFPSIDEDKIIAGLRKAGVQLLTSVCLFVQELVTASCGVEWVCCINV